jgi:polar amino acid transport system substrate-binding protein
MGNHDNRMKARIAAAGLACALLLDGCTGNVRPSPAQGELPAAPAIDPTVKAQLAPTGVLRLAVFTGNPLLGSRSEATGEIAGATVTLGKALADRAGVALQLVEYMSTAKLVEAAGANAWDVTLLGVDAARRDRIDYAPIHVSVDFTYLVGPAARISSVADADRAGVRIAATRGSVPAILLSRSLQKATFVQTESEANAFDLLKAGKVQAIAQDRSHLIQLAPRLPDSRVLDDRLLAADLAMALPKGRRAALAYVEDFIEQAKAAGLVQRAIDAAELGGVTPAR